MLVRDRWNQISPGQSRKIHTLHTHFVQQHVSVRSPLCSLICPPISKTKLHWDIDLRSKHPLCFFSCETRPPSCTPVLVIRCLVQEAKPDVARPSTTDFCLSLSPKPAGTRQTLLRIKGVRASFRQQSYHLREHNESQHASTKDVDKLLCLNTE